MLPVDSAQIDADCVAALCADRVPESVFLEFKRLPPANDARGRFELCKDVSSFANADGGDLVFGIDCIDDAAASVVPIGDETADHVKRRLLQILDAGVEPRLLDIEYISVVTDGGFVLVLRVPASFDGPHWVKREGTRNFFVRREVANIEMTYFELRSAFDRSSSAIERGRAFRSARSSLILENAALARGPKCVVHYLPLASLSGRVSIDVKSLYRNYSPLLLSGWGGASRFLNLDGLLITPGRNRSGNGNGHEGYVQLFREGLFEAVSQVGSEYEGRATVGAGSLGEFIREAVLRLMDCASQFGLRGTAIVSVSLFGMDGKTLVYKADPYGYAVSDRNDLIFPEVSVSRLPDGDEREALVRVLLDAVWQGFDLEFCTLYDTDGSWKA